jgi:putative endonuclease
MKFFYVYVLHNVEKNFIYIGYSENLKPRIAYHNAGKVQSTKPYLPLELIHYEAYKSKADAKRRELYLKSNRGRTTLMTMLKEYFANLKPSSIQKLDTSKPQQHCDISSDGFPQDIPEHLS